MGGKELCPKAKRPALLASSQHHALVPTMPSLAVPLSACCPHLNPLFLLLFRFPVTPSQIPFPPGPTSVGGVSRRTVLTHVGGSLPGLGSEDPWKGQHPHHAKPSPPPFQEASCHQGHRVEGLYQLCREPVACRLPAPTYRLGPSKAPHSGPVQVRGPLCTNKGTADAAGPPAQCPAHSPHSSVSAKPSPLKAQTGRASSAFSPLHHQPEHAGHTRVDKLAWVSCLDLSRVSPSDSCLPTVATVVGTLGQLFAQHLKQSRDPTPFPPKCLGPTMGRGGGHGLTAWSVGTGEGCKGGGRPAVAGAGTCGRGRPRCRWYRTPGGTGDLQRPSHSEQPVSQNSPSAFSGLSTILGTCQVSSWVSFK